MCHFDEKRSADHSGINRDIYSYIHFVNIHQRGHDRKGGNACHPSYALDSIATQGKPGNSCPSQYVSIRGNKSL